LLVCFKELAIQRLKEERETQGRNHIAAVNSPSISQIRPFVVTNSSHILAPWLFAIVVHYSRQNLIRACTSRQSLLRLSRRACFSDVLLSLQNIPLSIGRAPKTPGK
jgi:hypothetical protein